MMPNFRAGPSLQKPMSTGPFTALTPQNRPLDFQKTLYKFTPPRKLVDIDADLKKAEDEILRLLREVTE